MIRKNLLLLLLLVAMCSCSTASAVEKTSSASNLLEAGCATELTEPELAGLLAMDFSEGIALCEYVSPFEGDGAKYGTWLATSIQEPELTEGEARLLGMTITPPDSNRFIAETLGYVSRFYNNNGRMPLSGAELFSKIQTTDGLAEIKAMDPDEQYHHLYAGVNPVTGRFFTDFGDPEWRPGGMYFEPVTDNDLITERFHNAVSSSAGPPSAWRVIVFGEKPDTILIDKYVATNCHQRTHAWPRTVNSTVTEK